jgi:RHS repeat-associated protein
MRTNCTGAIEATCTSLPFGDGSSDSTSGGSAAAYGGGSASGDASHFAGLDHDYETGTDHAQFRQYSPAQGRWMSPDPYGGSYDPTNPQSMNRYSYVLNNPLSFVDPEGLQVVVGCAGCWGAGSPNTGATGGDGEFAIYDGVDGGNGSYYYDPDTYDDLLQDGPGPGLTIAGDGTVFAGDQTVGYTWQSLVFTGEIQTSSVLPGSVTTAPNKPTTPPLTPQQQHAQQQEMLNRKCFAANAVSNTLWITSGINALGAVGAGLSGFGAPLVPILGGISAVEAIGAGGYRLYASFVCYQATQ